MSFTDRDLAVLIPMLGRAQHVAPLLESIGETVPSARPLFLCTEGDDEVIETIRGLGPWQMMVFPPAEVGDYARKINAGYRATTEPLLFLGASDIRFRPGWFEAATAKLRDPRIGVVGTNDLGSPRVMKGYHATHCLVTRDYADRRGTIDERGAILFEGYVHEFVDDELVGTARKRGAWAMALDSIVEHLHPNWGKGETDAMYEQQGPRMAASRDLHVTRRRLWR